MNLNHEKLNEQAYIILNLIYCDNIKSQTFNAYTNGLKWTLDNPNEALRTITELSEMINDGGREFFIKNFGTKAAKSIEDFLNQAKLN